MGKHAWLVIAAAGFVLGTTLTYVAAAIGSALLSTVATFVTVMAPALAVNRWVHQRRADRRELDVDSIEHVRQMRVASALLPDMIIAMGAFALLAMAFRQVPAAVWFLVLIAFVCVDFWIRWCIARERLTGENDELGA